MRAAGLNPDLQFQFYIVRLKAIGRYRSRDDGRVSILYSSIKRPEAFFTHLHDFRFNSI